MGACPAVRREVREPRRLAFVCVRRAVSLVLITGIDASH